ncbi:ectonucleoside triphosphate diphosphohydrolase 6-like isoform X2 [Littorina saxatilis]|uniref:ectonucleoside triphosphate diphosphohydrolase 6-like isoform X2 n=1 Tax=Littorina saxatilis TaxID=31220 RepID=UPI0038B6B057
MAQMVTLLTSVMTMTSLSIPMCDAYHAHVILDRLRRTSDLNSSVTADQKNVTHSQADHPHRGKTHSQADHPHRGKTPDRSTLLEAIFRHPGKDVRRLTNTTSRSNSSHTLPVAQSENMTYSYTTNSTTWAIPVPDSVNQTDYSLPNGTTVNKSEDSFIPTTGRNDTVVNETVDNFLLNGTAVNKTGDYFLGPSGQQATTANRTGKYMPASKQNRTGKYMPASKQNRTGKYMPASKQKAVQQSARRVEKVVHVEEREAEEVRYGVLVDAGSSSSKVKVYNYTPGSLPSLVPTVQLLLSERVKPGLGNYVTSLPLLPQYLADVIGHAVATVPERHHPTTPIYVMATAGLRTLPMTSARALLGTVRDVMHNVSLNPFSFRDDHVSILSGEEEAVYAWLAVNYINGFFSSRMRRSDSVGLLEMGGGSLQVAFLPDGPLYQEEFQVYVGRRRFDLYATSYLTFGTTYMTDKVHHVLLGDREGNETDTDHLYSPCVLNGDTDELLAGHVTVKVKGTGDPARCESMLRNILRPAVSRCSPRPCAIGERYQPPVGNLSFYAISAFVYAPRSLDAVEDGGVLNITKLRLNAWDYCAMTGPWAQWCSSCS